MKNKRLVFVLLFLHCTTFIYAQLQVDFIGTRENLPFHLVRGDSLTSYFVASDYTDGNEKGSRIYQWVDNELQPVSFILHLNDTLVCNQIVNFWVADSCLRLLIYATNPLNNKNYMVLGNWEMETQAISIADMVPVGFLKGINYFLFKDMKVNDINHHILIEHTNNGRPEAIIDIQINENSLELLRAPLPQQYSTSSLLLDCYYDQAKNIFILNIGNYIFALNQEFEIINVREYKVQYPGVIRTGPWRMILGHEVNDYTMYENSGNIGANNRPLFKREIEYLDSFIFDTSINLMNTEEDCHLVRKTFKGKFNYLYYSRSTINNFDNNYGFNIWVLDKKGDLLKNFDFDMDRPTLLLDIDVEEKLGLVYGVVENLDDSEQSVFVFELGEILSNSAVLEIKKITPIVVNTLNSGHLILLDDFKKGGEIQIHNLQGNLVFKDKNVNGNVDISNLTSGMYILTFIHKNIYLSQKIVIIQ